MSLQDLRNTNESKVISKLNQAGYEAYFVGGCVRDTLMGRPFNDVDVTTNAEPEETKAVFEGCRFIDTGLKHGTVTVLVDGEPVEITTFRTEGEYTDKRHPDSVSFVKDVTLDLARRDLTINAIAMDLDGNVVDPFGGQYDIQKKIIRAVGNPVERFDEDALRIMRTVRFAAQYGFEVEKETEEAMFACKENMVGISIERIYTEFKKLIVSPYAGPVIEKYIGILGVFMPRLERLVGFQQQNPAHKYDVLGHCIKCMENIRTTGENEMYMKMVGLFHDIGKPDTFALDEDGIGHCFGHPQVGAEYTEEILEYLKAERFTIDRVTLLVRYHDLLFKRDRVLLKKWLNKFGPEILFEILEIKRADNLAVGCDVSRLIAMFDDVKVMIQDIIDSGECYSLASLAVNGGDIINHCGVRGRRVGVILEGLLNSVIEGVVPNEKAPLLEEAMLLNLDMIDK